MRHLRPLAAALALLGAAAGDPALPYNPTRAFLAANGSAVYIFEPAAAAQSQLAMLDLTRPLNATPPALPTLLWDRLPFLHDDELVPYTPVADAAGHITVIAGNCSQGASGTHVWRFNVNDTATSGASAGAGDGKGKGNGTWTQYQVAEPDNLGDSDGDDDGSGLAGPNFLANGMAFAPTVAADPTDTDIFVFGGMCPDANSTAETWTSAAAYSNLMLQVAPHATPADALDYQVSLATGRGPPIAEAGFSITPLAPTYSANTSGQAQTQQQDFMLLGGHTGAAFINMSQVALFSLPQESWTFLPVAQPSSAKTDLAVRQSAGEVQPRSGHTAVLSPDGTSVILFGGWVGDVTNPAEPQLAVLEFLPGDGDADGWSWSVPTPSGSGPASGAGLFGHGAAMLPGGVMLIVGGYSIPAASSSAKRSSSAANDQIYLYNVTSNAWINSYAPPASVTHDAGDNDKAGPLSSKSEQAGLGAGLGVGAALVVSLVALYFWYNRRSKRAQEEERGRALLSRSSDWSFAGGHLDQPFLTHGGIDGRGGDAASDARFWHVWEQNGPPSSPPRTPQMEQSDAAGSTGLFVNMPSPTRGLRKGVAGRNHQYHAGPRYDDKHPSRGSGSIHPIAEREDEDTHSLTRARSRPDGLTDNERKLQEVERILRSQDPFAAERPNPLGSHPVSPEVDTSTRETVRRVPTSASRPSVRPMSYASRGRADLPNWTAERDPAAEPPLLIDTGRVSPSKSDGRTESTLSESSITRTMSTGTGAMLAAVAAEAAARAQGTGSPEHSSSSEGRTHTMSTSEGRTHTMSTSGGRNSPFYLFTRGRSSTNGSVQPLAPNSAGTDADSFVTARTNFAELQSQGEALLGGRPMLDRDDPYQRALVAQSTTTTRDSTTLGMYDSGPSRPPVSYRRRPGWMGSLRRALNVVAMGDRTVSLTGTSGERYDVDDPASTTSSPTKRRRVSGIPRRAASDGGTFLQQKRGQKDWEDGRWPRYRDDPDPGDWGIAERTSLEQQQAEEDWDVEGAAERRDVQFMFTVPKARLRVVNADIERTSMRSASESALSRSESVRTLTHERSLAALRARAESDGHHHHPSAGLPSTVEEKEPAEGGGQSRAETPSGR